MSIGAQPGTVSWSAGYRFLAVYAARRTALGTTFRTIE
jgi:hypothetical protein